MTCKMKLSLWYLCSAVCVIISALGNVWFRFGWFIWVIPLAIFSLLIVSGVVAYPLQKAGRDADKYKFVRLLEAFVIIVPVIAIILNFLVYKNGKTDAFFEFFSRGSFVLVVICLIIIVAVYIRKDFETAAKIDKELQSNSNRN
jgi:predicted ABC-type exoprotein transport system permease subunit